MAQTLFGVLALLALIPCAACHKKSSAIPQITEASNHLYNQELHDYDCTYNRRWSWLECDNGRRPKGRDAEQARGESPPEWRRSRIAHQPFRFNRRPI